MSEETPLWKKFLVGAVIVVVIVLGAIAFGVFGT